MDMDLWASLRVHELVWKGLNIDVLFLSLCKSGCLGMQ